MASAGRSLAWAALGVALIALASACSSEDVDRTATCEALDRLGVQIASYQELLVWPGVTAAPLQQATDELAAAVLEVPDVSHDAYAVAIAEAFVPVGEAFSDTIPSSLVELRPGEPAQMAAAFISVEFQPLAQAHARAVEEHC